MTAEVITGLIAGIASIIAIFFGRQYWLAFAGLIDDLKGEVDRLQEVTRTQRDRLDDLEKRLHHRELELLQVEANLDNYVNSSQLLTNENKRLRSKVKRLEAENLELRSTIAQFQAP